MLKLGWLTKRRDACYQVRSLLPSSHLTAAGHQCLEETFEIYEYCMACRTGPIEYQWSDPKDYIQCPNCGEVIQKDTSDWKKNILDIIEQSDIVILQRAVSEAHLELLREIKKRGKIVVVEHDDNVISVPEWNTGYKYHIDRKHFIEQIFREADALTVTTHPLRNAYLEYNKKIFVLPNSLDLEIIDATPPLENITVFNKHGVRMLPEHFWEKRAGRKFILWGGSPTHEKDLELTVGAIRRISRQEDVCFGFVGYVHRAFLEILPDDKLFLFSLIPFSVYFMLYKALKAEIGFAPVTKHLFNDAKSNLKAIEYQAVNVLPVMSDYVTYSGCSPRGIYAKNDEYSWYKAFQRAIHCEDYDYRLKENRKFIENHFDMKNNYKLWENVYEKLLGEK